MLKEMAACKVLIQCRQVTDTMGREIGCDTIIKGLSFTQLKKYHCVILLIQIISNGPIHIVSRNGG